MTPKRCYRLGYDHVSFVKTAGDTVRSYGLRGRLVLSNSGWLLLEVPNAIARGAFAALHEPGIELPLKDGQLNAHISVMRAEEVAEHGLHKINEIGKHFSYTLGPVKTVKPTSWNDVSRVWMIEVDSPELKQLRKTYGLTPLPCGDHEFHITFAVRRKHVLGANAVSKAACFQEQLESVLASNPAYDWYGVPGEVNRRVTAALPLARSLQHIKLAASDRVFYRPEDRQVLLLITKPERDVLHEIAVKTAALGEDATLAVTNCLPENLDDWCLVKSGGSYMKPVADAWQALHAPFGGPTPLSSALIGGALTAGLGYAGGRLAEQVLPEEYFERGRLPVTAAAAGGLLGASLGSAWGGTKFLTDPVTGRPYSESGAGWLSHFPFEKQSINNTGFMFAPTIPVDAFNRVVWSDVVDKPNVFGTRSPWGDNEQAMHTPPAVAAAASGLISGVSAAQGGTSHVSPWSVIGTAAATGVNGYVAGMVGGKVLGALAGLKPEYQKQLQSAGLWGGLLTGAVRSIFGI